METLVDPTMRRRQPVQRRSRATFERILEASLELLAEGGLSALTTNAVAAKAGLSVNAVYGYFPDKYAIMHELFRRSEDRRSVKLAPFYARFATADDWRPVLAEAMTALVLARSEKPHVIALHRAMSAVPALREVEREYSHEAAEALAAVFRARQPELSKAYSSAMSRVLVESWRAGLDACVRNGRLDRRMLDAFIRSAETTVDDLLTHPR